MRTILIVLAALLIAGCGGAGSAGDSYKPKESDAGTNTAREERGTNTPATAADTAIGETVPRGDFEFRVLDVVRDESWRYPDPDDPFGSSAQSYAGEFAVVWYAVRNTGDAPLNLGKLGDTPAAACSQRTRARVSGSPRTPHAHPHKTAGSRTYSRAVYSSRV